MNRFKFACRNVADKLRKVITKPSNFWIYVDTYVLSRLTQTEPEAVIVSYPKCGRTWLRVMMQDYMEQLGVPSKRFSDRFSLNLPDGEILKFDHHQGTWVPAPSRTDRLSLATARYAGKKVVFLVRDPRDVVVSSWYHLRYRERIYKDDLATFVRDPNLGIRKIIAFMNLWLENRGNFPNFLLLTYEGLHAEPETGFRSLLKFLKVPINEKALEFAISRASFDNMKKREKEGAIAEPWMNPGAGGDANAMKIRQGKVGGFRRDMDPESILYMNELITQHLARSLPYHDVSDK